MPCMMSSVLAPSSRTADLREMLADGLMFARCSGTVASYEPVAHLAVWCVRRPLGLQGGGIRQPRRDNLGSLVALSLCGTILIAFLRNDHLVLANCDN